VFFSYLVMPGLLILTVYQELLGIIFGWPGMVWPTITLDALSGIFLSIIFLTISLRLGGARKA
jgi:hypothetical protein